MLDVGDLVYILGPVSQDVPLVHGMSWTEQSDDHIGEMGRIVALEEHSHLYRIQLGSGLFVVGHSSNLQVI